jgi:hypothetical protein
VRKEIQGSPEFAKCLFRGLNRMFRWSTSGVAFALLLSSQMISFGLIGETPDQCAVRYGVPTRQDENSMEYRLKNRVLVVTFVEGRAACITCSDTPSEKGGAAVPPGSAHRPRCLVVVRFPPTALRPWVAQKLLHSCLQTRSNLLISLLR